MTEYINYDGNWTKTNKTIINDTKTNEYINKAELMKEAICNSILCSECAFNDDSKDVRCKLIRYIDELPTIEILEAPHFRTEADSVATDIVHCSECIHAKLNCADGEYYCEILQYDFAKDHYCADGERWCKV